MIRDWLAACFAGSLCLFFGNLWLCKELLMLSAAIQFVFLPHGRQLFFTLDTTDQTAISSQLGGILQLFCYSSFLALLLFTYMHT